MIQAFINAMIDPSIGVIVAALIGGGVLQAIVNFRKAGKEADNVVLQSVVLANTELRTELARRAEQIRLLTERVDHLEQELKKQLRLNVLELAGVKQRKRNDGEEKRTRRTIRDRLRP